MKEKQSKNIINLIFIGTIILSFLYSMGFFTSFLQIRGPYIELYDSLQKYNKQIFNLTGLLMIFGVGLMVMFDAHKKTERMIFSKIAVVISAATSFFITIVGVMKLPSFIAEYSKIDVEEVILYYPNYSITTSAFYVGYIIFGLLSIAAVLNLIDVFRNKVTSDE